jgi:hypothetical protein
MKYVRKIVQGLVIVLYSIGFGFSFAAQWLDYLVSSSSHMRDIQESIKSREDSDKALANAITQTLLPQLTPDLSSVLTSLNIEPNQLFLVVDSIDMMIGRFCDYDGHRRRDVEVFLNRKGVLKVGDREIPEMTTIMEMECMGNIDRKAAQYLLFNWVPEALIQQPCLFLSLTVERITEEKDIVLKITGRDLNGDLVKRWKKTQI